MTDDTGSAFLKELTAKARFWRDRPPSGRFVLHRLPPARFCRIHGRVTKYHSCPAKCALGEFSCLPGCSPECNAAGEKAR